MSILQKRTRQKGVVLLAGIVTLMTVLCVGSAWASVETVDLRGYGKVKAEVTPNRSEFVCENEKKADMLLGKLLADMFWDAKDAHTVEMVEVTSGGWFGRARKVPVHTYKPYGMLVAGRNGNKVVIVGAGDKERVVALAEKEKILMDKNTVFEAGPYPKYLDRYDLGATCIHTLGLHPENRCRWRERSEFVKKFFPEGGFFGDSMFVYSPAEGVDLSSLIQDTDIYLAEKDGLGYSISVSTGAWPDWAVDRWPEFIDRQSPVHLTCGHGHFATILGFPPESFGMTPKQRRETSLRFLKDVMLRYNDSPVVSSWELYCGDYICETYFSKDYQGHLGYNQVAIKGFHRWLEDVRGYTLKELGRRWYGNEDHFKSWDEVIPPDPDEFFGNLNAGCFKIENNWQWKKADKSTLSEVLGASGWTPVDMPPSQQQYALPQGPAFWKVRFDPANWLKKHAGESVYLVFNVDNRGWAPPTEVWLNGRSLGFFESKVNPFSGPFGLKVDGLLNGGENELCLRVNGGSGCITGPVFLTVTSPKAYPYLGKHANARYVDVMEWRLWELNFKVADTMEYARGIDPNRPFVICATSENVKDAQGQFLRRYGGSMQDTGYESSYRPLNSRLGYAGGFYGSCEPSCCHGIENPPVWIKRANRRLGWTLFNGEGMYKEWRAVYPYIKVEEQTGWFTENRRKYQLIGKTLPAKPEVAVFLSSRSALLGDRFHSYGDWNIGRGELATSHYDNVFVTESMLADGLVDDYKVLFDTDTMFMGEETIGALQRYVEKGGTFVALHNTGRHGILEPDSWPISRLTGFEVVETNKKGKIKFGENLSIFKGWEGKVFEGEGSALDWKENQSAKDVSIGLKAMSEDVIPLARWEDGSVAVGMRKLGKGRVIVLGSTFWRYGKDLGGSGIWEADKVEPAFLERLFTDLGVERTADASTGEVFARKMVTKNGLENWLVAMSQRGSERKADAGFAVAEKPSEVVDKLTGKTVPFEYKDGWVWIKNLDFEPWEVKIFAVKREDLTGGVKFWWFEKEKFWKRRAEVKPISREEKEDRFGSSVIQFGEWKFFPDKDDSVGETDAWTQPTFDDGRWRDANNMPWNFQYSDLEDYSGVGLYRSLPFAIPSDWANRHLFLNINGYVRHMGYCWRGFPDFYVNGEKITGLSHSVRQVDVTNKLKKEGNVVAIRLEGREASGDYPVSGLLSCGVWIQPEVELEDSISLAGEWQAVTGEKTEIVVLPGQVKGNHFIRDFTVPAKWKGKDIYLHLKNPVHVRPPVCKLNYYDSLILVNGKARIPFDFMHRLYIPDDMLNITPYVKFGQENRVTLYPKAGNRGMPGQEYELAIECIEVGYSKK